MCQEQDTHQPARVDASGGGSLKIAVFFMGFVKRKLTGGCFFFFFLSKETLKPGLASHLKGEILYCTSKTVGSHNWSSTTDIRRRCTFNPSTASYIIKSGWVYTSSELNIKVFSNPSSSWWNDLSLLILRFLIMMTHFRTKIWRFLTSNKSRKPAVR